WAWSRHGFCPCDDGRAVRLKPDVGPTSTEPKCNWRYNQREMPASNSRDRMIEALRELPPDATVDDAIERLVFLAKIEAGLAELDRGEGIPHDEAKRRLGV